MHGRRGTLCYKYWYNATEYARFYLGLSEYPKVRAQYGTKYWKVLESLNDKLVCSFNSELSITDGSFFAKGKVT